MSFFDLTVTPFLHAPICFVDVETTGLVPESCRVVELAMLRGNFSVEEGAAHFNEVLRFSSLINPDGLSVNGTIAEQLCGITDEELSNAPHWKEVAGEVENFVGGAVFAGHNAPFDLGFLQSEQSRVACGVPHNGLICTLAGWRKRHADQRNRGGFKLINIVRRLLADGVEEARIEGEAHRALYDARCSIVFLTELLNRFGWEDMSVAEVMRFLGTGQYVKGMPASSELEVSPEE